MMTNRIQMFLMKALFYKLNFQISKSLYMTKQSQAEYEQKLPFDNYIHNEIKSNFKKLIKLTIKSPTHKFINSK